MLNRPSATVTSDVQHHSISVGSTSDKAKPKSARHNEPNAKASTSVSSSSESEDESSDESDDDSDSSDDDRENRVDKDKNPRRHAESQPVGESDKTVS